MTIFLQHVNERRADHGAGDSIRNKILKVLGVGVASPETIPLFYIMETKVVTRINGVEILASVVSDGLVPVKPMCDMLQIDFASQFTKLKDHPIYGSTVVLSTMVAADKRER